MVPKLNNMLVQSYLNLGYISLINDFLKLKRPFRNTNAGQMTLSFIGPSFWNQIPKTLKKANNLNTFKCNLEKLLFCYYYYYCYYHYFIIIIISSIVSNINIIIIIIIVIISIIIINNINNLFACVVLSLPFSFFFLPTASYSFFLATKV